MSSMSSYLKLKTFLVFGLCIVFVSASAQNWSTTGNGGTDTSINFIGTTDYRPLRFKANNITAMLLSEQGYVYATKGLYTPGFETNYIHMNGTNPSIFLEGNSNSYYPSIRIKSNAGDGYIDNYCFGGLSGLGMNTRTSSGGTVGFMVCDLGTISHSIDPGVVTNRVIGAYGQTADLFRIEQNTNPTYTVASPLIVVKNNGNLMLGTTTDNGQKLQVAGDTRIDGKLGIGVTPLVSLDVAANASNYYAMRITHPTTYGMGLLIQAGIDENDSPDAGRAIFSAQTKSGAEIFRVANGGQTQMIASGDKYVATIRNTNNTYGNGLYIASGSGVARTALVIDNGNGNRLFTVSNAGNVGLGTNSPLAQLHTTGTLRFENLANDNTKTRVLVMDVNGNASYRDASTLGGSGGSSISGSVNYLAKYSGSSTIGNSLVYDNGTSVGIGTININETGYKLFVESGVRTRKVKVDQGTWADYVFETDYKLPTLAEVEAYIKTNKHLPDVPSAKEIEQNGLDLGDNQSLLLKKIEELTLYIIEQQKEITELKKQSKEILEIKKQLETLSAQLTNK